MKKFVLFLLGFFIGIIIFMPKDNLYYTLQNFLKKQNVYINSDIKSSVFLSLKNGTVYYKGMDVSKFKEIDILPFVFYNQINGENIKLNIGNYEINSVKIFYTLFYPVKIFISGKSNFGELNGYIDLIKREVKIYVNNLTKISIKNFLKKDKKGYFYYAKF